MILFYGGGDYLENVIPDIALKDSKGHFMLSYILFHNTAVGHVYKRFVKHAVRRGLKIEERV